MSDLTFDGTAEYVRADELREGDVVREAGGWHTVLDAELKGLLVFVVCTTGYGWSVPRESRTLRKIQEGEDTTP